MDPRHPYLSRQLIAYIGNKRSLLRFLEPLFSELATRVRSGRFVDPFAGSGSVARLGKYLGLEVSAGDLEHYAWVLNAAALEVEASEKGSLFRNLGGLEGAFGHFNDIGHRAARGNGERGYIARHYAPQRTEDADYRRERLFYTVENARFIDAVRDEIEARYPGWDLAPNERKEKLLLLAALLYEVSTHANTSGVFKAFHKGFGGHGKDALGRIMAPAELEAPELIDGRGPSRAVEADAVELLRRSPADIVYLDPPYNQHQYGSNYFMLNTVARWDKPAVPAERHADGRLKHKAGIRRDWTDTRSEFCYSDRAEAAFERVLDATDARFIVLSYSTDGIVPLERILELLERRGRVELFATDYVQYRGGRQSISRRTRNVEFALVVTTGETPRPVSESTDRAARAGGEQNRLEDHDRLGDGRSRIRRFLLERRLVSLLGESYVPERVRARFDLDGDALLLPGGARLSMPKLFRFQEKVVLPETLDEDALRGLEEALEAARCTDRREEASVLLGLLESKRLSKAERRAYRERFLWVLRKFAYRKYEREFEEIAAAAEDAVRKDPVAFDGVETGVVELRDLARRRFEG